MLSHKMLKIGLLLLLTVLIISNAEAIASQFPVGANNRIVDPIGSSGRKEITWDYDSLYMYKITHNQTYLAYARAAADSLKEYMLNDKGLIRNYSRKAGASDSDPRTQTFICSRPYPIWRYTIPHTSPWPKRLPME